MTVIWFLVPTQGEFLPLRWVWKRRFSFTVSFLIKIWIMTGDDVIYKVEARYIQNSGAVVHVNRFPPKQSPKMEWVSTSRITQLEWTARYLVNVSRSSVSKFQNRSLSDDFDFYRGSFRKFNTFWAFSAGSCRAASQGQSWVGMDPWVLVFGDTFFMRWVWTAKVTSLDSFGLCAFFCYFSGILSNISSQVLVNTPILHASLHLEAVRLEKSFRIQVSANTARTANGEALPLLKVTQT
jgi:hypothetical protein